MPASIGALITSALSIDAIGGTVIVTGTSITVNTVVGAVALSLAEAGLSALLSPKSSQGAQQFTVRQPIPARREFNGRNKAGGYFFFLESLNGNLYQGILQAAHKINVLERWVGDVPVTLDGSGNVTLPDTMTVHGNPVFQFLEHDGDPDQTADATLIAKFPSLWDSDHRLRGIANTVFVQYGVSAHNFTRYYPGGAQQMRMVFDGAATPDPRNPAHNLSDDTTWAIGNDNAASVILRFVVGPNGWGLDPSVVTPALDDWKQAADDSDEVVALVSGGSDKRYRLVGSFDLTTPPKDTQMAMLSGCDGWLWMRSDGAVSLKVGKWEAPTVTLDESTITGYSFADGNGILTQANEIVAQFTDANQDYQPVQAQSWRDEDNIALLGEVLSKTLDASWCPTHNQTRRMMKIASGKANPPKAGTITTNQGGLDALGERRVHISIAARGIAADFEITSTKIDSLEPFQMTFGVVQVDSAAYDFDAATEEGTILIPPASPTAGDLEVPQHVAVAVNAQTISNGIVGAAMTVTCDTPTDRFDLQFHAEYQIEGDTTWTTISVPDSAYKGVSDTLAAGTYDVRTWFSAPGGTPSEYVTVPGIIVYFGSGSGPGGGPLTVLRDEAGNPVKDDAGNFVTVS